MADIAFTIPANASTLEYPVKPEILDEWWTYAGDNNTDPSTATLYVNAVTGKFGTLRVYADGVLFYSKLPDFAARIEKAEDKNDVFTIVKRNKNEILENKVVTVSFAGVSETPVEPPVTEEGLYNVNSLDSLVEALSHNDVEVINITDPFEISEKKVLDLKGATINGNNKKISITHDGTGIVFTNAGKLVDVNVEKTTPVSETWNSGYNIQLYNGTFEVDNLTSKGNQAALLCNSSTVNLNGVTTLGNQTFGGIEASKSSNANMPVAAVVVNGTIVDPTETEATPAAWIVNDGSSITGFDFASEKVVDGKTHYYINNLA